MRSDWREVPRGDIMPQYAGIYVTMNKMGDIVMSRVTYETMGSPQAFVLLYDPTNNRIGLKPAAVTERNAYPVRTGNARTGSKLVRGHRLTRDYRIDLPGTMLFPDADTDKDSVLVLDFRTAYVSKRARNHFRNRDRLQEMMGPPRPAYNTDAATSV